MVSEWVGGRKKFVPTVSQTVKCIKLILGRDIGWGCRCATSWCDLDLGVTFDLPAVTLTFKILSGQYLGNR